MMEEAYNSIISAGSVAIILCVGLVLVYKHMKAENKELKAQLVAKDLLIEKKDTELKEIVKENITLQTRILDTLKILSHDR